MLDERTLGTGFAALSRSFSADRSLTDTLESIATAGLAWIPHTTAVVVTLMERDRVVASASTDPELAPITPFRDGRADDPGLAAFRTAAVVQIGSTPSSGEWQPFCGRCVDHGIMSVLSVPLTTDGVTGGVLSLYSTDEDGFLGHLDDAELFARLAAVVAANASTYWSARTRADQLEEALLTRAVIEQAKGIIISTMRCSAEEAFSVLVRQSRHQNRKLRHIASEIVGHASRRP